MNETEAIDPDHPLAGVRAKLARAQQHLDTLDEQIGAFMERGPYLVSYERKPDGSEHIWRIHVEEQPPLALGPIIGDFLNNMRSALDHLIWQLAILAGKERPSRQTAFPICDTEGTFRSKGNRNKVADLSKEYRAAVERLQPFQIGGAARDHWLWHLNELSRVDKHQILHPVGAIHNDATFSTHPVDESKDPFPYQLGQLGQTVTTKIWASLAPFQDEAPIARWTLDPPRPDVKMEGNFSFYVSFGEGVEPAVRPVTDVLENILRHVEGEVLPPLSYFFDHG